MTTDTSGNLHAVYGAQSSDEIAALYDAWSQNYDDEMGRTHYRHPGIATALMARHLPTGSAPVLDAGAGTGLAGDWLSILGYPHLEAIDISEGMMAKARAKNIYKSITKAYLGGDLPFPEGHFAGLICTGVLTTGHVGPEALPGMLAVLGKGGILVASVKEALWADDFLPAIDALIAAGKVEMVESTAPYISMPGDAESTPSRAIVLRKL